MSLKHAILGFLAYRPLSGYDLKKAFDSSVRHFWPADQSQIYRTLAQLTADGLAEREAAGDDPRDRHVYHLTAAGRAELRHWLTTPLPPHDDREPFLIQVFFAAHLEREEALALIERQRELIREQLALYTQLYQHMHAQQATAPNAEAAFYSILTLEHALSLAPGYLRWLDSAASRIAGGEFRPLPLDEILGDLQ